LAKRTESSYEEWYILDGWRGLLKVNYTPTSSCDYSMVPVPEMKGGSYGIDGLLENLEQLLEEGNKVLAIKNVYEASRALNTALLSWSSDDILREKDTTILIFTGDRNIFSEEVWKRMIIIKPPRSTPEERESTMINLQQMMGVDDLVHDYDISPYVALTAGMTQEQLESVAVECILRHSILDMDFIAQAKTRLLASNPAITVIEQTKFGFEGIGGYSRVKEIIRNYVVLPLENPEIAERFNVSKPRGIIFFGSPGSGKTLFVNSMAKELSMSVLKIQMENVLGKYVGQSEKSMRNIFDIADAMEPCILFLDEIDRLSKRDMSSGDNSASHVERELFSMLLEKLGDEKRKWFFAGATNMVQALDPALIRTGRVDSLIPIPFPDKEARKEIFQIHTTMKRKLPLADDIDIDTITEKTFLWSGSDIEQLVIRTTNYVMKEAIVNKTNNRMITMDDFLYIIESFNINIKENGILQEKIKKQALDFSNDKRLINVFDSVQELQSASRVRKGAEIMKERRKEQQKK
jgi:ATP-dependent 26S proteasome regulatory subunit